MQVHSLSVRAKGKLLLENTQLSVTAGRRYGLVGPNGKGKSTLLRLIARRQIPVPEALDVLLVEQVFLAPTKLIMSWKAILLIFISLLLLVLLLSLLLCHLPPMTFACICHFILGRITVCTVTYNLPFKLLHDTTTEQCFVLRLCLLDFLSSAFACSDYTAQLALIAAVVLHAGNIYIYIYIAQHVVHSI